LCAGKPTVGEKSRLALAVSVIGWNRSSKLLLPGPIKLSRPVRVGAYAQVDFRRLEAQFSEIRADSVRPLAAAGVIGDEVLEIAAIVEQFLGSQPFYHLADNRLIEAPVEELRPQFARSVIAAGQRIERRGSRSA
jgi:hypothetical protein